MTLVSIIELIGTGIALGVIHILTGPDHLSAIVTLSANEPDCLKSFWIGARWGIGHSAGLLVVGIALILYDFYQRQHSKNIDEDFPELPEYISHILESLVGIFLVGLGLYGLRRAVMVQQNENQRGSVNEESLFNHGKIHYHSFINNDHDDLIMNKNKNNDSPDATTNFVTKKTSTKKTNVNNTTKAFSRTVSCFTDRTIDSVKQQQAGDDDDDDDFDWDGSSQDTNIQSFCCKCYHLAQWSQQFSEQSLAIVVGLVHGVAGPGGVLGVLPAVQLHNGLLAAIYLTSFCLSSTCTMGCFGCFYGTLSFRLGRGANLEYQVHLASAGFSLLLGIAWLILLAMGKLDDIFG